MYRVTGIARTAPGKILSCGKLRPKTPLHQDIQRHFLDQANTESPLAGQTVFNYYSQSSKSCQLSSKPKQMKCPYCLTSFHESWASIGTWAHLHLAYAFERQVCPACTKPIVRLLEFTNAIRAPGGQPTVRLIVPKATARTPLPPEVPPEFTADYLEAVAVLPDSEKASAALSRRCLQHLLHEKLGINKNDLAKEIQQLLDSKQLPTHLSDDLDAIRNIGNFSAHPLKVTNTGEIVDVEPGEAEWSLEVLEQLFDFYFVLPARSKAKRDALNAKLQHLVKPAMKDGQ